MGERDAETGVIEFARTFMCHYAHVMRKNGIDLIDVVRLC